jgi:ubiquinone/menaquinone biosynthesis C-methylase UbiE
MFEHLAGTAMSAEDRETASAQAHEDRRDRFQAVTNLIRPDVSSILDLGCGIGSWTSLLADRFPSALIVGLDGSRYLLEELKSRRMKPNILLIRAEAPILPLRPKCFDLVLAVQVLHEIYHFKGERELLATINHTHKILREGGVFIVLDHRNPGETPICARLSRNLLRKLRYFELRFKPRRISFETLDDEWVRMSMRDFYDFVTKIWALETGLEEEEMNETHTPFTEYEFARLCRKAGFEINYTSSITPIDSHLKHYGIDVRATSRLPERHFVIAAQKIEKKV